MFVFKGFSAYPKKVFSCCFFEDPDGVPARPTDIFLTQLATRDFSLKKKTEDP